MRIRALGATAVAVMVVGRRARVRCGSDKTRRTAGTTSARVHERRRARGVGAATPKTGYLAPNQPDVNPGTNGKKFVIGILSPGDTHDHGYYQSFVDEADALRQGTRLEGDGHRQGCARGRGAAGARNLCRQKPDMVAIAASELKDAIPVASEPVCKNTVWYVAGGEGVVQTKYFAQTNDIPSQSGYASGVAAGLIMKDKGITKAGFITGLQAVHDQLREGVGSRASSPRCRAPRSCTTYTGDFDKSDLAVEAY